MAHSLSPVLHSAGYRTLGLTSWSYTAHELGEPELAGWVAGLDASWRGLSLTMPLKEVAFSVATTVTETARVTGAVNTLVRRPDGGWDAHNTDVRGIEAALADIDHGGGATLLGGGATARSAVIALGALGVEQIRLAVRGEARPETLRLAVHAGIAVEVVPWLRGARATTVDSCSAPFHPRPAKRQPWPWASRSVRGTLMDVVYADWPTPLARAAAAVGMDVVSGLDMLVYQAAEQFRLFTGEQAPLQAMYAAGRQALGR